MRPGGPAMSPKYTTEDRYPFTEVMYLGDIDATDTLVSLSTKSQISLGLTPLVLIGKVENW